MCIGARTHYNMYMISILCRYGVDKDWNFRTRKGMRLTTPKDWFLTNFEGKYLHELSWARVV